MCAKDVGKGQRCVVFCQPKINNLSAEKVTLGKQKPQMGCQAESRMQLKETTRSFSGCYLFVLTLLEVLGKTHMSVHDSNHAYIQSNSNDVQFMGVHEGLQVFMHQGVASSSVKMSQVHNEILEDEDAFSTSTYLKFVPPRLDFKERFLGVPHLEKVTLVNTDENKTIHMSSVSGNTLHFHSSFFQDKMIPPKGNTTFSVVFLGRTEGQVSTSLHIHTSEGTFRYQVSGASVCSPYRLRPLGGVRLPLNAAFQPLIQIHNPHHYPIQVMEVYSSGSEFHLELPGGEIEGPKAMWEVPPYTTKPVIRAKFQASAQSNHTAYIRLKLNNSEEVLVVPVEVEVTSQPGLYSHQHSIDFGIGGSQDKPKKVRLYLCSSLKKTLRIQSVTTIPVTSALRINFEATKIPPGTSPVEVAELLFDWKTAFITKQTSGKIYIKSKQNQYKLVIPFTARVLEGGLRPNKSATRFLTTEARLHPRRLTVENQFQVPVAVNNVTLEPEASEHFTVQNFKPMVIPPNESVAILTLRPKEGSFKDLRLESELVLSTNVSDVVVPLLVYNGKLTRIFPRGFEDLELLDVGLVGCSTMKKLKFGLQNNNPVAIEIESIDSDLQFVSPRILGVYKKNASEFLSQFNFANLTNSTNLKPNDIAVVELVLTASKTEGIMKANVAVSTQYEKLLIPVRMSAAQGSLELVPHNEVVLDDCFPGKICTQPVKIQSTFKRPMTATSVSSMPPDYRLSFAPAPGGSEILPGVSSYIGDLKWEPGKRCGNHCYLGVSLNSSGGLQWMHSDILSSYTSDMDATLLRDRYHRLLNVTNGFGSGHWQELLLRLDTNEVREELFKARVRLIWPKFSNANKFSFPLTQVRNTTVQRLKLFNSASHTVVVQLVMEWAYPQAKRLVDSFPPSFRSILGSNCYDSSPNEFYMSEGPSAERRGKINATLAPGETYEVPISYTPSSAQKSCSLLFVRNNLTVIEVVELRGQASYAQLKFGNRKPGSDNPLMFEIAEKHLKDCHREKNKKLPNPNLTVKRSFTVRNVGELSVFVHNFYINGLECEGYGYSVLNCASFELPINGTKKIDVAFTPDFTLTKIQRILTIDTSLGVGVNYTLVTTLPPLFLSACSSVLSRPTWEPLLYYSAVSFMVFLLFCVLAAAFFESDRILKCALMTLTRDKTTLTLDLKQVGSNIAREFGQGHGKKQVDGGGPPDHADRARHKEEGLMAGSGSGPWHQGSPPEDRADGSVFKGEDSPSPSGKEKDCSTVIALPGLVPVVAPAKNKKKLTKKNSNSTDVTVEQTTETVPGRKRDKNVGNSDWCSVFSRSNADKPKSNNKSTAADYDHGRQVRSEADTKKEVEIKREDRRGNRGKRVSHREAGTKDEEETSSTTTDSSNDAEKENADAGAAARLRTNKLKKEINRERKANVLECKENNYFGGDFDEDEVERERRSSAKATCKGVSGDVKPGALAGETSGMGAWRPNAGTVAVTPPTLGDPQKNLDFQKQKTFKNGARERKEKGALKRRLCEKSPNPKLVDSSPLYRSSPCWEHRSFSEVVARNESPLLYSSIVSPRTSQQKQVHQSEPIYSEVEDSAAVAVATPAAADFNASALGPIGSKKPPTHWSQLSYNSNGNPSNTFQAGFSDLSSGYLRMTEYSGEKVTVLDEALPVDPENLWEDQHAAMELLHQQYPGYQLGWKDHWLDYLWCSNRGIHASNDGLASAESYGDAAGVTWGSLLRTSWAMPTAWSPSEDLHMRSTPDSDVLHHHFPSYDVLHGADGLMGTREDIQAVAAAAAAAASATSPNRVPIELGPAANPTPAPPAPPVPPSLDQILFGHRSPPSAGPPLRSPPRDGLSGNGFQFDPFHSLSSIWAPKTQNTWNSSGN